MSANPHANGGTLLHDLELPDFRDYGSPSTDPATTSTEATRVLGTWLLTSCGLIDPRQLPRVRAR